MKYAKVKGSKIIDTSNEPKESYVPIDKEWEFPTEFPRSFYSPTSTKPRLFVEEGRVIERWEFNLKDITYVKSEIFSILKEHRKKLQLGSFMFGEVEVPLTDREDSLIISSLPEVPTDFKIGEGTWVTLTGEQVRQLKTLHSVHVQKAYTWEKTENMKVQDMTTHEELKEYLKALNL